MNGPTINKFCVNPVTNTFVIYYNDGTWQDTQIQANCNPGCSSNPTNTPCFSAGQICTPKSFNSFINTIQYTENNEMIIGYSDGNICSLGTICKCTNVLFGYSDYPGCCPGARCGDVYINLENGNVFKFFGRTWDKIGNISGPTGPTGPTGNAIQNATINDDSLVITFTNGQVQNVGSVIGPTGPTGLCEYSGTGFFGQFNTPTTFNQTIDLLRQPYTFYPTFFGTGIGSSPDTTPAQDAVVLGNHNDLTGPNNANYTIAIGYYSGQINQQSSSIAIGKTSGYNLQGTGSIAIGDGAGYTSQGMNSIALGVDSGSIHQQTNSVSIGYQAGLNTQGTGSIALGSFAGYTGQGQYSIAIGYEAGLIDQASNSIVLSAGGIPVNNTTPNSCVVYPIRNVNGTASTRVYWDPVTYEMTYGTEPSSIRYKENVVDLPRRYIESIFELRPVEFNFKNKNQKQIGLIAEQVNEILPEVVIRNADSVVEGIDYQQLIAPMIEIIKEYKDKIVHLENLLSSTIESYQERITQLESLVQ